MLVYNLVLSEILRDSWLTMCWEGAVAANGKALLLLLLPHGSYSVAVYVLLAGWKIKISDLPSPAAEVSAN